MTEFEKVQMSNQSCRVSLKTKMMKASVKDLKQQIIIDIWKPSLKLASEGNESLAHGRSSKPVLLGFFSLLFFVAICNVVRSTLETSVWYLKCYRDILSEIYGHTSASFKKLANNSIKYIKIWILQLMKGGWCIILNVTMFVFGETSFRLLKMTLS